jgi:polyphosphate glucokinase
MLRLVVIASDDATRAGVRQATHGPDRRAERMRVLTIDVGGTNVKILSTGQTVPRKVPSGPTMTPKEMVTAVKALAAEWQYDAVTIGYPGQVIGGRIVLEPHNLGRGWVGFDFKAAFGRPVRIINDAAMQALGSYQRGLLLFLGLGTGMGAALVADGVVIPMELAHLPYKRRTFEGYVGGRGLRRMGRKKWQKHVEAIVAGFIEAFHPDDVVLGGGNTKKLKRLPAGCRAGSNANAFIGGFRLWNQPQSRDARPKKRTGRRLTPALRFPAGSGSEATSAT